MAESVRTAKLRQALRAFLRARRIAAVLALCCVVLPTTGFWVDGNDMGRGICAVRMRIDFHETKESSPFVYIQPVISRNGPEGAQWY